MKVLKWLNGLPGIILAIVALAGVFRLYVRQKEQTAVAQYRISFVRDSVERADSIRADSITAILRMWRDSTAGLQRREEQAKAEARRHNEARSEASEALHALVDTNAVLKAAVDSLEARQARQVLSLMTALARADSTHQADSTTIVRLTGQIAGLQSSNARLLTQLDAARDLSSPSFLKKALDVSPLVASVFGIGIGVGVALAQ